MDNNRQERMLAFLKSTYDYEEAIHFLALSAKDLSMDEVNDFISWYEDKEAGTGTASYAINKHDNNKGPFKSRKDYVIFDKILTFSVDEYNQGGEAQ